MKRLLSVLLLTALTSAPIALYAQTGTASSTKKAATLSSTDKQLVKKAGEAQLALMHLGEVVKGQTPPGTEPVQKLGQKTVTSINESWGELGSLAAARGAELPKTDMSPAEKKDIADLKKTSADKFDKTYLKAFLKETKRGAAVFADGAKGASDADLKAYFTKWQPKMATLNDEVNAAEAEESKKK